MRGVLMNGRAWGVLRGAFILVLAPALAPTESEAQAWSLGGAVSANLLVGENGEFLEGGLGLEGFVSVRINPRFSVRADGGWIQLDEQETPGEEADNSLLFLGVGPEVGFDLSIFDLSFHGIAGFAANRQRRSGTALDEESTRTWLLGAGFGIGIPVRGRVSFETGADLLSVGELDFARTAESGGSSVQDLVVLRGRVGVRVSFW